MKHFMDKDFLLESKTAKKLYHSAAEKQPIWDYHCHLNPKEIADNRQFSNITEIWLGGDHYKWRQMRTAGIPEKYITGDGDPYAKFLAWARTVERLMGNPLYHWTHLELQRYFGIYEPLSEKTASAIWEKANTMLARPELSVKGIFESMNVYAVGTTDDPADTLEWHKKIADGTAAIGKIKTKVVPSFRPDKALYIEQATFPSYIKQLSEAAGTAITNPDELIAVLEKRLVFFKEHGCRASDHALPCPPFAAPFGDDAALAAERQLAFQAFERAKESSALSEASCADKAPSADKAWGPAEKAAAENAFKAYVLSALAALYKKHGIVMQLHFGATRSNNPVMLKALGPDTGFDACDDQNIAAPLSTLLGRMEAQCEGMPRTILYSLNPKDYQAIGTLMGAFQGACLGDTEEIPGKIQLGAAWWFCDHRDGMEQQLKALGNLGMLSAFTGMLTDSRSFLSYPRHEYFRRILCNLIGGWVENGEYPADWDALIRIVNDISFGNAFRFFE
ncbi:MAG: glucuronate isomerase [Treponema sp.]|nr:glucuronate isomerase [Candidatus Treponema caballi]